MEKNSYSGVTFFFSHIPALMNNISITTSQVKYLFLCYLWNTLRPECKILYFQISIALRILFYYNDCADECII